MYFSILLGLSIATVILMPNPELKYRAHVGVNTTMGMRADNPLRKISTMYFLCTNKKLVYQNSTKLVV